MGISGSALLAWLGADATAAAGTAAAVDSATTLAALGAGEATFVPAVAGALGAGDVLAAGAAGLGAAGAGGAFGGSAPAAGAGAGAGAAPGAPGLSPSAFQNAINAPSTTALQPASFTPGSNFGSPAAGPGAAPGSTVAPSSVPAVSPDVSAAFGPSGAPNLTGNFDAATQGAATGTGPFNTGAVGIGSGAGPTAGTGGASTNTIENLFNNPTGGNLLKALGANASPLIAGAGLGADLLKGNQTPPGYSNILGTVNQLSAQANTLESYINSGTLPPGIQNSIHSATESAKATIRSQYASRGMSGSSAEAQDLANADTVASTNGANIAMSLLQQGISENQLSTSLYSTIMNEALTSDSQLSSAIGQFAAAAAGGNPRGGSTININGGQVA